MCAACLMVSVRLCGSRKWILCVLTVRRVLSRSLELFSIHWSPQIALVVLTVNGSTKEDCFCDPTALH